MRQRVAPDALEPVRVLELRSVWGTGGGPDKTILKGAARTDPTRFAVTVCYVRDGRDPAFGITARAHSLPIDYVEVVERHSADWRVLPQLRAIVRARQIRIVHSHDYKTDVLALLLRAYEGVIPLSTAHGWSGETRKDRFYYDVNKRTLRRFARVLAVSGRIKDELLRYGCRPERVVVVPNGIDTGDFRPDATVRAHVRRQLQVAPETFVVGAVGRLETVKCFDSLIDAFRIVRERLHGARLLVIGEGPQRAALEEQIVRLGLTEACVLLGHRSDVSALCQAFDVCVQSSRSEGSPNAVLEAMALEVPVVATDVGGTRELITHGEHGLLVPFGDVRAIAGAIETCATDPAARDRRVRAARARIESELSFDGRCRKVEGVYQELAAVMIPECGDREQRRV